MPVISKLRRQRVRLDLDGRIGVETLVRLKFIPLNLHHIIFILVR